MKKIVMMCCMMLWSGQANSACINTIPASTPTTDFTVNGNGTTVTHKKTGLMWKQCPEGLSGAACATGAATAATWQGALLLAETLNNNGVGFAGFMDWRVPNIKELGSILEVQCHFPPVNETIFPANGHGFYWSSSQSARTATEAWIVSFFGGGGVGFQLKSSSTNTSVRLVRGGQ